MSAPGVVAVRDLTEEDLAWMAGCEERLFGPSAWSGDLIRQDFRYGFSRYRGVEADGALAGYAVYGFEGDAFHLMNLAVVPEHRRRGLGRALMDDLLAEARAVGAPEVWLEVSVENAAAIALYRAYGFDDVRLRRKYYQPEGVDALVMRRRLAADRPAAR